MPLRAPATQPPEPLPPRLPPRAAATQPPPTAEETQPRPPRLPSRATPSDAMEPLPPRLPQQMAGAAPSAEPPPLPRLPPHMAAEPAEPSPDPGATPESGLATDPPPLPRIPPRSGTQPMPAMIIAEPLPPPPRPPAASPAPERLASPFAAAGSSPESPFATVEEPPGFGAGEPSPYATIEEPPGFGAGEQSPFGTGEQSPFAAGQQSPFATPEPLPPPPSPFAGHDELPPAGTYEPELPEGDALFGPDPGPGGARMSAPPGGWPQGEGHGPSAYGPPTPPWFDRDLDRKLHEPFAAHLREFRAPLEPDAEAPPEEPRETPFFPSGDQIEHAVDSALGDETAADRAPSASDRTATEHTAAETGFTAADNAFTDRSLHHQGFEHPPVVDHGFGDPAAPPRGFTPAHYADPSARPFGDPGFDHQDLRNRAFHDPGHAQQPFGQPPFAQHPPDQQPYGQPPYGQPPHGDPRYGDPGYGQQPFGDPRYGGGPGHDQQAFDQQAFDQQAFDQQAFGQQAFGEQPHPDQGYPEQGYPDQRFPDPRFPDPRFPDQPHGDPVFADPSLGDLYSDQSAAEQAMWEPVFGEQVYGDSRPEQLPPDQHDHFAPEHLPPDHFASQHMPIERHGSDPRARPQSFQFEQQIERPQLERAQLEHLRSDPGVDHAEGPPLHLPEDELRPVPAVWKQAHPSARRWADKRQRHGAARAPSRPRIVSGLLLAGLGAWLLLIFLPGRKPLTEPERVRISRQAGVDEHAWRFPPPLYQATQGAAALYVSLGFLISVRGLFFRRRVELQCKRCQRVVMAERGALLMRCESGGHSAGVNWGALILQLAVLVVTLSLIGLVVMAQLKIDIFGLGLDFG